MWATPKPAHPMARRSSFCTGGLMTSIASPRSPRRWRRRGDRVIVPFARGYGTTRFLSGGTLGNGQQAAVAMDVLALLDALGIDKAVLAGFGWGARPAGGVAALWPDRCTALVWVSGYLIGSQAAGKTPSRPRAEHAWWYQYYFATERGRAGEPHYDDLERRLAEAPAIAVPAITLEGDANGAPHPDPSAYAAKFTGKHAHRTIAGGVGHNLPQKAPQAFTQAIVDADGL